jgi:hypothetical protein
MRGLPIASYVSRYPDRANRNTKFMPNLQAAIKAAYPNFAENKYISNVDLALYWAREIEKTEYLITLANILGLVYFGRQSKNKDLFTLGFTNTQNLKIYLTEIGWEKIYNLSLGDTICLIKGYRADFIQTFWADLASPSIYTQTLRKGLTPVYLEKQLAKQQRKLNDLLGESPAAFHLIATNLN